MMQIGEDRARSLPSAAAAVGLVALGVMLGWTLGPAKPLLQLFVRATHGGLQGLG